MKHQLNETPGINDETTPRRRRHRIGTAVAAVVGVGAMLAGGLALPSVASAKTGTDESNSAGSGSSLSAAQRATLLGVAKDTWKFFEKDVDPVTHLPLDNIGPGTTRGAYTSAANIGVYLESVVAANDLRIISRPKAVSLISATLKTVGTMQRDHGFLHQWYSTDSGHPILNPGSADCSTTAAPAQDNCSFLSAVDNGWYASGLLVVRSALPELRATVNALIAPMDFSIFYDNRAQTSCNTNPDIAGNQPTGQMYGGYYTGQGPAGYHNGAIYSDPRIAMYVGMGLHQMPGDVWWRTWRTLPPKQCDTDPDFTWQGQAPAGYWTTIKDPQTGKPFKVWEGHYTYPGTNLSFIPTWGGGMFEGLMANEIVPETAWGTKGFGLADVRTAQVQVKYATEQLKLPVWGMSPSSTADDTGNYGIFGAVGQTLGTGNALSQCGASCANVDTETTVTPHASFLALGVIPQEAYANIQKLRTLYPDSYSADGGFYDAVNPTTGAVGHRRLVLDQSMIMMSLDNALANNAMRGHFAADPAYWAARVYLGAETMSLR
jgi:hypothetical protein